ncbi:response regulator [Mitsuaria sp. WAJ17]|uniref:response regulator transcription factor n=1 Tax=Mitsuaria sp. WAJ17 TaxID=2761452 RepID=UPI001601F13C|nr:response regulator [Mitsuaria sp. WAJ17]MBB2487144.1 response regulator [Mitsuaria sp. WAJ17]
MPAKLLIVEDQADIRRLIRWALEEDDYEIREAANGSVGLDQILSWQPDMVLLDMMMPGGIDGLELCRQVRASPGTGKTIIVMLTAKAASADQEAARAAGADYFLPKPFSPAKLSGLLHALLKHRQDR